jgi:hypothetical protein
MFQYAATTGKDSYALSTDRYPKSTAHGKQDGGENRDAALSTGSSSGSCNPVVVQSRAAPSRSGAGFKVFHDAMEG